MWSCVEGAQLKPTTCMRRKQYNTDLRKHESGLHCRRDRAEYENGPQLVFRCVMLDDLVPLLRKLLADLLKLSIGAAAAIADMGYDTVGSLLLEVEKLI